MMKMSRLMGIGMISCLGMTSSCRPQKWSDRPESIAAAKKFKADLLAAITAADRIEIVEHSFGFEFQDYKGVNIEDAPYIEYKRIALSDEQKIRFRASFELMSDSPKESFSMCIFAPHHTIELIRKDGVKSEIHVCFKCGDTQWNGSEGTVTEAFQGVFKGFMEPLGFQSHRDWEKLANSPDPQ